MYGLGRWQLFKVDPRTSLRVHIMRTALEAEIPDLVSRVTRENGDMMTYGACRYTCYILPILQIQPPKPQALDFHPSPHDMGVLRIMNLAFLFGVCRLGRRILKYRPSCNLYPEMLTSYITRTFPSAPTQG